MLGQVKGPRRLPHVSTHAGNLIQGIWKSERKANADLFWYAVRAMAVPPGTKLGQYEVLAPIGAGGMGEVYRAHDNKLGRDVALKLLPESYARDPERLVRFRREAQLLASLNHPNIATIHGLEDTNSSHFLTTHNDQNKTEPATNRQTE